MKNLQKDLLQSLPTNVVEDMKICGIDLAKMQNISHLGVGLSNQNFHLINQQGQWVLRVNSLDTKPLCERTLEVESWLIAYQGGIAPKLEYASSDSRYLLSQFCRQESFDWGRMLSFQGTELNAEQPLAYPSAVPLLQQLLLTLTALPAPEKSVSLRQQWYQYQQQLQQARLKSTATPDMLTSIKWLADHRLFSRLFNQVDYWIEQVSSLEQFGQYSHRDLNPHNILYSSGRLICIDFEYTCCAHPLWDLATVLATHKLSKLQRKELIDGYLNNHPKLIENDSKYIAAMVNLYWVFSAAWALLMSFNVRVSTSNEEPSRGQCLLLTNLDEAPKSAALYRDYFIDSLSFIEVTQSE